ncbi:MAG: hypothetical protein F4Y68_18335 [Boseongicola sp. SB0665_bin_10]|nr:hypothetical protein [Boseongicola sp. SB0665_bin_10]
MTQFNRQWMTKFGWPIAGTGKRPLTIAHRGASGHRTENSLTAFALASDLFAEMWELDLRMSADGVAVVSHDENLARATGRDLRISEATWSEICSVELPDGQFVPRLEDVADLAVERGAGLYIEAKSEGSASAAWQVLEVRKFTFAAIGSFNVGWIAALRREGCPYPLSVLVPSGADPFSYGAEARPDILHLCWRDASSEPHKLITEDLVSRCERVGAAIVLWHEDRRAVLDGLDGLPVLGICSGRPEILKPYRPGIDKAPGIVCHRGANFLAPENTREAARLCIDQCFQFVEIDVRTTADGELVVIHDATLNRTTNGIGPVSSHTLAEIRNLDAGGWKAPCHAGFRVPTLSEMLDVAQDRIGVYVEIKDADPEAVLGEVVKRGMMEAVFFWCWKKEVLRDIRSQAPDARLMVPRREHSSLAAAISDYSANIVEFELGRDSLSEITACRELGVQSMVFCLSNDLADLAKVLAVSPDLVNLDRPDLFKILQAYPDIVGSPQELESPRVA